MSVNVLGVFFFLAISGIAYAVSIPFHLNLPSICRHQQFMKYKVLSNHEEFYELCSKYRFSGFIEHPYRQEPFRNIFEYSQHKNARHGNYFRPILINKSTSEYPTTKIAETEISAILETTSDKVEVEPVRAQVSTTEIKLGYPIAGKLFVETIEQTSKTDRATMEKETAISKNEGLPNATQLTNSITRKATTEAKEISKSKSLPPVTEQIVKEPITKIKETATNTEVGSLVTKEPTMKSEIFTAKTDTATAIMKSESMGLEEQTKKENNRTTDTEQTTVKIKIESVVSRESISETKLTTSKTNTIERIKPEVIKSVLTSKERKPLSTESQKATTKTKMDSKILELITKTEMSVKTEAPTAGAKVESIEPEGLTERIGNLIMRTQETTARTKEESIVPEDPPNKINDSSTGNEYMKVKTEFVKSVEKTKVTPEERMFPRTKAPVITNDKEVPSILDSKELLAVKISATRTISVEYQTNLESSGIKTLKTAVAVVFLASALIATTILTIYMIKVKRKTAAYDQLKLLP